MLIITYTLLLLYALPMFVLLITFVISIGFTQSSNWIEFTIPLSAIYLTPIRDALGTFVVPFVTAYATSNLQRKSQSAKIDSSVKEDARQDNDNQNNIGIKKETMILFFTLVLIFLLSIVAYSIINMRIDLLLAQLNETNQSILSGSKQKLLDVVASYVKESLAYISLLLGISQSSNTFVK